MTQFEFITVFISIVLAFGVSDILSSWGEQIRLRKQVRIYWLHIAWSALLLVLMVQVWWSLWHVVDRPAWTFPEYLVLIAPFLILAVIAYVLTPSLQGDNRDIREHYWSNSGWVFSLAALYVLIAITYTVVIVGDDLLQWRNTIRAGGFLLLLSLALWRNEKFHALAVIIGAAILISWVSVSLFRI